MTWKDYGVKRRPRIISDSALDRTIPVNGHRARRPNSTVSRSQSQLALPLTGFSTSIELGTALSPGVIIACKAKASFTISPMRQRVSCSRGSLSVSQPDKIELSHVLDSNLMIRIRVVYRKCRM
jgi:hypothetical protein